MRPEEVLTWLHATPFVPFRLLMNSGRTYDVRHPELVRLLRSSLMLFTPSGQAEIYDRAEMVGLNLVERIEPMAAAAGATPPLQTS